MKWIEGELKLSNQKMPSFLIRVFENYIKQTGNTICGRFPLAFLCLLSSEKNDLEIDLLEYKRSEDVTSLNASSVSYVSMAVAKNK